MSTEAFTQVCQRVSAADFIVMVTHVHPDGDALGSMIGFAEAARSAGKNVKLVLQDCPPIRYEFLIGGVEFCRASEFDMLASATDLIVVVDTNSKVQLGCFAEQIVELSDKTVIIDHHATSENLGSANWTDTTACAAGLMILDLTRELGWSLNEAARDALAIAMLTDTGWMRFSNTDGRCLRAIADLKDMGCPLSELYDEIFNTARPAKMMLIQRALASMELHYDNRLAVMVLRENDFYETHAWQDETENIVNEAMRMGCVDAAVIIVQTPEVNRVSLRSRRNVDVAQVAREFGGGGHVRAAGCKVTGNLDKLKQLLIEEVGRALASLTN